MKLNDLACDIGPNLIELLHDFNQSDGLTGVDGVANFVEDGLVRGWPAVEDSREWGDDLCAHVSAFLTRVRY